MTKSLDILTTPATDTFTCVGRPLQRPDRASLKRAAMFFSNRYRPNKWPFHVLLILEFPFTVALLALFGIAAPDLYRTLLWQDGSDNGFNSNPNAALYAAANYRPYTTPRVWSSLYAHPSPHSRNAPTNTCPQYHKLQCRYCSPLHVHHAGQSESTLSVTRCIWNGYLICSRVSCTSSTSGRQSSPPSYTPSSLPSTLSQ